LILLLQVKSPEVQKSSQSDKPLSTRGKLNFLGLASR